MGLFKTTVYASSGGAKLEVNCPSKLMTSLYENWKDLERVRMDLAYYEHFQWHRGLERAVRRYYTELYSTLKIIAPNLNLPSVEEVINLFKSVCASEDPYNEVWRIDNFLGELRAYLIMLESELYFRSNSSAPHEDKENV